MDPSKNKQDAAHRYIEFAPEFDFNGFYRDNWENRNLVALTLKLTQKGWFPHLNDRRKMLEKSSHAQFARYLELNYQPHSSEGINSLTILCAEFP